MEATLAFTLGVLSVFFVATVTILAWGIVGVIQLSKKITQLENRFEMDISNIWRQAEKLQEYSDRSTADTCLEMDRRFEHLHRSLEDQFRHCESYTDSRIDKALSREQVGKKILKDNIN
jgi:biopolymer transport protein ExbB/TolQ